MTDSSRDQSSQAAPDRPNLLVRVRWPLVVVLLAVLVAVVAFRILLTVDRTRDDLVEGAGGIVSNLGDAASRFMNGTITTTFTSSLPHLVADGGTKLELAVYEEVVEFSSEDSLNVFWDLIPLGTTTTEIRVPTTFRYHLLLSDTWHLTVRGSSCVVHAPAIRPSLPPAIDISRMERRSERGWARFNTGTQMQELETNMSNRLKIIAADSDHINLVREQCRVKVAEFVREWLLREDQWRDGRFTSVIVVFADEELEAPDLDRPTLQIKALN